MRLDRRLLGWGTFFILLGAIPLAVQQGYLDKDLVGRWFSLWPLLLIGWGLGLVLRETPIDWLGGAVTTLTFGVMGGSFIAAGFHGGVPFSGACNGAAETRFSDFHGTLNASQPVTLELPCGTLTVRTTSGTEWSLSGTAPPGSLPVVTANDDGLTIAAQGGLDVGGSGGRTAWDFVLPTGVLVPGFNVTLNAGDGDLDLGGAQLEQLAVTVNAGELRAHVVEAASIATVRATVNAGSATIDLPSRRLNVGVTVNAGSAEVCVPAGSALRVSSTSTLGSTNLDDLDLEKIDDDTWQTRGFASAEEPVELAVTTTAGSVELAIGGSCGA